MPFVQVHTAGPVAPETMRSLGQTLANVYGTCMQTNARIVNVGFLPHAEGALARYDAADGAPQAMTIVTCDVRSGRSPEMLEALGRTITEACARELGLPEARIAVYISEHAAHEIYRDGGRAPAWSPAEAAPTA
jgi:phenylpyruvate tautomerase PptA (4-oxalocrotonate tautomerase family)